MISSLISRLVILLFGTLYPAYSSYKAVRTKNVKEYVKWMMYWIVFAFFTTMETFTDVFLGFWFPFYYEIKIVVVVWLLSPATRGASILYRKFVHPMLTKRETEIDEYLSRAKEQGYQTVIQFGARGMNYATSMLMQTVIKHPDQYLDNPMGVCQLLRILVPGLEDEDGHSNHRTLQSSTAHISHQITCQNPPSPVASATTPSWQSPDSMDEPFFTCSDAHSLPCTQQHLRSRPPHCHYCHMAASSSAVSDTPVQIRSLKRRSLRLRSQERPLSSK